MALVARWIPFHVTVVKYGYIEPSLGFDLECNIYATNMIETAAKAALDTNMNRYWILSSTTWRGVIKVSFYRDKRRLERSDNDDLP